MASHQRTTIDSGSLCNIPSYFLDTLVDAPVGEETADGVAQADERRFPIQLAGAAKLVIDLRPVVVELLAEHTQQRVCLGQGVVQLESA